MLDAPQSPEHIIEDSAARIVLTADEERVIRGGDTDEHTPDSTITPEELGSAVAQALADVLRGDSNNQAQPSSTPPTPNQEAETNRPVQETPSDTPVVEAPEESTTPEITDSRSPSSAAAANSQRSPLSRSDTDTTTTTTTEIDEPAVSTDTNIAESAETEASETTAPTDTNPEADSASSADDDEAATEELSTPEEEPIVPEEEPSTPEVQPIVPEAPAEPTPNEARTTPAPEAIGGQVAEELINEINETEVEVVPPETSNTTPAPNEAQHNPLPPVDPPATDSTERRQSPSRSPNSPEESDNVTNSDTSNTFEERDSSVQDREAANPPESDTTAQQPLSSRTPGESFMTLAERAEAEEVRRSNSQPDGTVVDEDVLFAPSSDVPAAGDSSSEQIPTTPTLSPEDIAAIVDSVVAERNGETPQPPAVVTETFTEAELQAAADRATAREASAHMQQEEFLAEQREKLRPWIRFEEYERLQEDPLLEDEKHRSALFDAEALNAYITELQKEHEARLTELEAAAGGFMDLSEHVDPDSDTFKALNVLTDEGFDGILQLARDTAIAGEARLAELEQYSEFANIDDFIENRQALAAMSDEQYQLLHANMEEANRNGMIIQERTEAIAEKIQHGDLNTYLERRGLTAEDLLDRDTYNAFDEYIVKEEVTERRFIQRTDIIESHVANDADFQSLAGDIFNDDNTRNLSHEDFAALTEQLLSGIEDIENDRLAADRRAAEAERNIAAMLAHEEAEAEARAQRAAARAQREANQAAYDEAFASTMQERMTEEEEPAAEQAEEPAGHSFNKDWSSTPTNQAFRNEVLNIAQRQQPQNPNFADHLMTVMAFETGHTFSPSERNQAGSGATGLIQFMPSTANGLGTSTEQLAQMSQIEQLEWVERYFSPHQGRLNSLEDAYLAVFSPAFIGKGSDYIAYSRGTDAYSQNNGFDTRGNNDGHITVGEIAAVIHNTWNQYPQR